MSQTRRLRVAFGPRAPGWGSWDWVGVDTATELMRYFQVTAFEADRLPSSECDVVVLIKHPPTFDRAVSIARHSALIYCPIDFYGSAAEIDAGAAMLQQCVQVVVHAPGLRRYFAPYAPVACMEHHVKFVPPTRVEPKRDGPILWVGVRSNLPFLADWLRDHRLPAALVVLTNLEQPDRAPNPSELGIPAHVETTIEHWTPSRHLAWLPRARAALDIKGSDFRQRHKPVAKAMDFIAAGLPLAVNRGSPAIGLLGDLGFDVALAEDTSRWLSDDYLEDTRRFGGAMRELLSLSRVARRYKKLIEAVAGIRCTPPITRTGPA